MRKEADWRIWEIDAEDFAKSGFRNGQSGGKVLYVISG